MQLRHRGTVYFVLVKCIILQDVVCWHDLGNDDFHCWPLSASADDPVPYAHCPGVSVHWLLPPPDSIVAEEHFNVSYSLELSPEFWPWAVSDMGTFKPNFFKDANNTGLSDPEEARKWCQKNECPSESKQAKPWNCCIHHVNVHSCPMSEVTLVKNGLCGPWIPASGSIFTHSMVLIGNLEVKEWTSLVAGLYHEGQMSLIAHFKLAGMHIALEKSLTVLPRSVCGDNVCEGGEGEDCGTCPRDCGRCPLRAWEVALIAVACSMVFIAFAFVLGYFKWKQQKLLWDESWIVDYNEIKRDIMYGRSFLHSRVSMGTHGTGQSGDIVERQIFTEVGKYMGKTLAMKEVSKKEFNLNMAIRKEVKTVRQLDHQNLCKFEGACIVVPNVCLLTEYCPKGALNDVLLNDNIPLNWSFRFSFASDIARGMQYLHAANIAHTRLKSSNCVIDDRWTVKITDYGLQTFRCDDREPEEMAEARCKVYRAPEVSRGGTPNPAAPDVYAYAVILLEIATRRDPYEDADPIQVKKDWKPPLPDLTAHGTLDSEHVCPCPAEFTKLISSCWANVPSQRPTFEQIKKTLQKINPDNRGPIDLMMAMMEKYSKHLELLVGERTSDLEAEKAKTDRLLYSMLPVAVADQLRLGKHIEAEQFDECTIYFSDIVGFTKLSGNSTPYQVVNLLNKLYTTFDSIIDEYDVYKVETIGDAYMVVSGVPKENGDNHASQIALMATDLLSAAHTFVIPHLQKEPLKVRIGIHSGPVCAGVVGLKMPRYCLFGDTVNTASRMESTGDAYKIHVSHDTYILLQMTGGFDCIPRGTISVKGKGEMKTYWLLGKSGEIHADNMEAIMEDILSATGINN